MSRTFMHNQDVLLEHHYGSENQALIKNDLSIKVQLHLQSICKYIKVEDIIQFMGTLEIL